MRRTKGFTLVELLVVIGIIALLISILLPALNKARDSGRTVKCLAGIRQLAMAMTLYAQANRDQLPYQGDFGVTYKGRAYPTFKIETSIAMGLGLKPNASGGYPQVNILQCPNGLPEGLRHYQAHPRLIPSFHGISPGYYSANQTIDSSLKLSTIRRSSQIAMFYEATQQNFAEGWNVRGNVDDVTYNLDSSRMFWDPKAFRTDTSNGYNAETSIITNTNTNKDSLSGSDGNRGRLRFRHASNRATNIVFVDGHAETLRGRFSSNGQLLSGGDVKQKHFYIDP